MRTEININVGSIRDNANYEQLNSEADGSDTGGDDNVQPNTNLLSREDIDAIAADIGVDINDNVAKRYWRSPVTKMN
jgi:hypothetical protein